MNWFDLVYGAVKGPTSNAWPILLLPILAALLCEAAARRLPPTRADWRIAAALAAAPGLLFLALAGVIGWRIVTHSHYDPSWQHFLKYQATAAIAGLLIARASFRVWRRQLAVARLVGLSTAPDERLRLAARRTGVAARSLPCEEAECFVAGALAPTVYVSTGAVSRLSDAELQAALRHELAHVRGRDTAVLALLGFLRDLVPIGSSALNAYSQARERSADEAAMRASGPVALASALLALARGPITPAPAIGIAGTASPAWRLKAILGAEDGGHDGRRVPLSALAALAVTVALSSWPKLQHFLIYNLCACH